MKHASRNVVDEFHVCEVFVLLRCRMPILASCLTADVHTFLAASTVHGHPMCIDSSVYTFIYVLADDWFGDFV